MKALDMKLRVGRVYCSDSDDHFCLSIEDKSSGVRFVSAVLTPAEFASMMTGSQVTTEVHVRGEDVIGKKIVVAHRTVSVPDMGYGTEVYEQWLKDNYVEEGWRVNTYLQSRGSISPAVDGVRVLSFSVAKYVDNIAPTMADSTEKETV